MKWLIVSANCESSATETSEAATFECPCFAPGSLDGLLRTSESLKELDGRTTLLLTKASKLLCSELGEGDIYFVEGVSVDDYMRNIKWNKPRYSEVRSVVKLYYEILSEYESVERAVVRRMDEYALKRKEFQKAEAKERSMLTKRLCGIDNEVSESESLIKLCVVVPLERKKDFRDETVRLYEIIVPQTTYETEKDKTHILYSLIVLRKFEEKLKKAMDKIGCKIRLLDESVVEHKKEEFAKERIIFLRKLSRDFGELMSTLVHTKILRLFSDSTLTYGLQSKFISFVVPVGDMDQTQVNRYLCKTLRSFGLKVDMSENETENIFTEYIRYDISI
eukprot:GHVP01012427.1.p1 GENE.GHVP01012427.1~~GHVP01012427.1.p1  ORF type:complete len:335 (-),score=54.46 GHVP01012427.1:1214-2218(-)